MAIRTRYVSPICLILGILIVGATADGQTPQKQKKQKKGGMAPKSYEQIVDSGVQFLKSRQTDDGGWSAPINPGITGIVLTGLFRGGKVGAADPVAAKGLKFIEGLVNPKDGDIANGEQAFHKNYITSVNISALKESGQDYAAVIAKARDYLEKLQIDEGEEKTPKDLFYGGAGYNPGARPDLSNTQFLLDALVAAGTPKDAPAFKKAVTYISRAQNLKSEANDQPWAGKINDGSFIYVFGADAGRGGAAQPPDAAKPGYGSMTCAGIKSLLVCGVPTTDPRLAKALEWFRKHYSVDINPGMPPGGGGRGYYYYLMTMVKMLDTLGQDIFEDTEGVMHDWRAEVVTALASRQQRNGSWVNETDRWLEGNPDLCTAYALITLSYCKPKNK